MTKQSWLAGSIVLLIALLALTPRPARGQELPDQVMKVLQHRIGTWEIRNDVLGPDGKVARTTSERHEAAFVLNGAIVEIHGFIEGHEDFRSFLLFNPALGQYIHTTIDRTNNHVVLRADAAAPYRFTSDPFKAPAGNTVVVRRVFETVESDHMAGYLEVSADDGTTWRRVYNQQLIRVR